MSVESGPIWETILEHHRAKEVAPLRGCPLGTDAASGLETKLIGEATGTDLDLDTVPVKLQASVPNFSLMEGKAPTLANDWDKEWASYTVWQSVDTGPMSRVMCGMTTYSSQYDTERECVHKANEVCCFNTADYTKNGDTDPTTNIFGLYDVWVDDTTTCLLVTVVKILHRINSVLVQVRANVTEVSKNKNSQARITQEHYV